MKYSVEDTTLTAVADKLREKTGSVESIAPEEMPGKVDEVFKAGGKSERERFWDEYQDYGKRTNYELSFAGSGWTDEIFSARKYDIPSEIGNAYMMFRNSKITDLKDFNLIADTIQYSFQNVNMTEIGIVRGKTIAYGCFFGCNRLKTIAGFGVPAQSSGDIVFGLAFNTCVALENLSIVDPIAANGLDIHWSTNLTHESLMSVIDALADYSIDTSGTEWKVTLGETNLAKLSEEEIGIAEAKGWVLA